MARDMRTAESLESLGWKRIVVWACELSDLEAVREKLVSELTHGKLKEN